jgi:alpha-methylacyl-CoA racemase
VVQPAPAPRFSRTPGAIQNPPPHPGQDGEVVLDDWGFSAQEQQVLRAVGAVL